ncbi:hypothetical protein CEQ30_24600 [Nocardia brasiliensis]|nr:hypothetical protein CEQ30_24600 [Nocardia brasiliensis]
MDDAIKNLQSSLQPTPVDRDNDGKPDQPAAEFDVAGKHLKFEMGADGLKLTMSDADGKPQEFSLKLDEHGVPVLSVNEPKAEGEPVPSDEPASDQPKGEQPTGEQPKGERPVGEQPTPAAEAPQSKDPAAAPRSEEPAPSRPDQEAPAPKAPAAEENTGQPGLPSGVPSARREEDGEHKPKPMPGSQNPDAPFDSGAELAEAGPL